MYQRHSEKVEYQVKVCRGCLFVSSDELPVLDEKSLISFGEIARISIFHNGGLPERLCNECLNSLNQCTKFKEKCQYANGILSQLAKGSLTAAGQMQWLTNLQRERQTILATYGVFTPVSVKPETVHDETIIYTTSINNIECVPSQDPLECLDVKPVISPLNCVGIVSNDYRVTNGEQLICTTNLTQSLDNRSEPQFALQFNSNDSNCITSEMYIKNESDVDHKHHEIEIDAPDSLDDFDTIKFDNDSESSSSMPNVDGSTTDVFSCTKDVKHQQLQDVNKNENVEHQRFHPISNSIDSLTRQQNVFCNEKNSTKNAEQHIIHTEINLVDDITQNIHTQINFVDDVEQQKTHTQSDLADNIEQQKNNFKEVNSAGNLEQGKEYCMKVNSVDHSEYQKTGRRSNLQQKKIDEKAKKVAEAYHKTLQMSPEMLKVVKDKISRDEKLTSHEAEMIKHKNDSLIVTRTLSVEEHMKELEDVRKTKVYQESTYKCDPCARSYLYEAAYTSHLKRHAESSGSFVCIICQQRYMTKPRCISHYERAHEIRYECKECGKIMIRISTMRHHVAKHTGLHVTRTCNICGQVSTTELGHSYHMRHHNGKQGYKCPHCPQAFTTPNTLAKHVRVEHTDKAHKCRRCFDSFSTEEELAIHSKTHTEEVNFYCKPCNKSFSAKAAYRNHLIKSKPHANANVRYQCDECSKNYHNPQLLQTHKKRYHSKDYKPMLKCDQCHMRYRLAVSLENHMTACHSDEVLNKVMCDVCGKGFKTPQTLRVHATIHTGEKKFSCDICSRAFVQKSALQTHIKLVHLKLKRPFSQYKSKRTSPDSDCSDS